MLHVVVGHGLPRYFLNAVRSVLAAAPSDAVLVVDNATRSPQLDAQLHALQALDGRLEVVHRSDNDVKVNAKVGSLYAAYALALERARSGGFDLLHLVQSDMQVLFWDEELLEQSLALYEAHPRCVNIHTRLLSRDALLDGSLLPSSTPGVFRLARYGLTDTGLFHLERWRRFGLSFASSEQAHAVRYLEEGFEVLCHPRASDAPIPWPAFVRGGRQHGHEVRTDKPFLLRPLPLPPSAPAGAGSRQLWLEDACVPWGWACLTPMWTTGIESIDYWVLRYRAARRDGLRSALPRIEHRGVGRGDYVRVVLQHRFRPSLLRLAVLPLLLELRRRAGARARRSRDGRVAPPR